MDNCRIGCTCSIECEEATVLAYAARRARMREEKALANLRRYHAQQSQVIETLQEMVKP